MKDHRELLDTASKEEKAPTASSGHGGHPGASGDDAGYDQTQFRPRQNMRIRFQLLDESAQRNQVLIDDRRKVLDRALEKRNALEAAAAAKS